MVSNARSTCFIQFYATAAGSSPAFTVPDGFTAIVKDVQICLYGATPARCVVVAQSHRLGMGVNVIDVELPVAGQHSGACDLVLTAGDDVHCYADGSGPMFWVSGALISSPPFGPPVTNALEIAALPAADRPPGLASS